MPATNETPRKKPSDHKPKSKQYGKKSWGNQLIDLDVPSGELVQVRRPGMQGLIKAGVLHSMDALTGIVSTETIPKAEGKPEVDATKLMGDPKKLDLMLDQIDKIVLYVVVQPELHKPVRLQRDENDELVKDQFGKPQPLLDEDGEEIFLPFDERELDLTYLDYVEIEDKMFIMNFALGGSRDLEDFRKKSEEAVGSISTGQAAQNTPV